MREVSSVELLRSLIFVPGNRANMLQRALDFGADIVMVDLEDSVPPAEKPAAAALAARMDAPSARRRPPGHGAPQRPGHRADR